jgi:hypothetical protein
VSHPKEAERDGTKNTRLDGPEQVANKSVSQRRHRQSDAKRRFKHMIKTSLISGAVLAAALMAGDAVAAPADATRMTSDPDPRHLILASGGGGGDAMGRGSDTSKGAVPDNPEKPWPSGRYPAGIESPGTAPIPPTRPGEPGRTPDVQGTPDQQRGMPGSPGTQGTQGTGR